MWDRATLDRYGERISRARYVSPRMPPASPPWIELPSEIIQNVLDRCTVKTVLRFKLTCKTFTEVLTHPAFTQNYRSRFSYDSNGLLVIVASMNSSNCLLSWKVWRQSRAFFTILINFRNVGILEKPIPVWSVNGVTLFQGCRGGIMFLYNSMTTEKMALPNPTDSIRNSSLGFGFSRGNYKVVLLCPNPKSRVTHGQVLTVGRVGWRSLGWLPVRVQLKSGTTVRNFIYWIIENPDNYQVLQFNLRDDSFSILSFPVTPCDPSRFFAALGVLDGALCASESGSVGFRLWTVDELSWKLVLTRSYTSRLYPPVSMRPFFSPKKRLEPSQNVLLIENNRHMVQASKHLFARQIVGEPTDYTDAVVFRPTFLCLKDFFGGDPANYEKLSLRGRGLGRGQRLPMV